MIFSKGEKTILSFKLRLHERLFACDGDAIFFLKIVASPARGVGYTWRQSPWFFRKKFISLIFSRFFSAIFSVIASPVGGWLQVRFSPRAGDITIFKKSHHHRKQKIARVAADLSKFSKTLRKELEKIEPLSSQSISILAIYSKRHCLIYSFRKLVK